MNTDEAMKPLFFRAALCGYLAARKLRDQNPTQDQIEDLAARLIDHPNTTAELYVEVHPDPSTETPVMRGFRETWERMLKQDPTLVQSSIQDVKKALHQARNIRISQQ